MDRVYVKEGDFGGASSTSSTSLGSRVECRGQSQWLPVDGPQRHWHSERGHMVQFGGGGVIRQMDANGTYRALSVGFSVIRQQNGPARPPVAHCFSGTTVVLQLT